MNDKDEPVFARDLNAVGAMAVLLKEAIKPNLVQTLENNPVILHGGPFANIAGAEKFFEIKCASVGLKPEAVVLVVTLKALRHHGGAKKAELQNADTVKLMNGLPNMEKHIENVMKFGMKPVVAINYFPNDSAEEIELVKNSCAKYNVKAIVCKCFAEAQRWPKKW